MKTIRLSDEAILLDTLSVVSSSIQVFDEEEKRIDNNFDIKVKGDSLILRPKNGLDTTTIDTINVIYRVFPVKFNRPFAHIDSNRIRPHVDQVYIGYDYDIYQEHDTELLFSKGLQYDGSFSRGLSFGNSQSLVLNSSFNLQLGGKISDDLEILASISDANIPIQAEGTTQQLQDFDKVFIQLKRNSTTLLAGDYEIARPNSYFINYYKKLQGISVIQENDYGNYGRLYQKGSAAISRGKFSRNTLQVREGNQGPYKLTGSEGERFLIVLSGTEKVYFDGKLMTRGEENDYVIYYDRAEISFTTNRLITKDSRIIVEFEYADQKYLRSLYQYTSAYEKDRFKLDFNLISEQDSRNTTGNTDLDSMDLYLLNTAGDRDQSAIRSGVRSNTEDFISSEIYYKKEFRPEINDSILVFTSNPDSAFYQANFSDVGQGQGTYVIDNRVNANGRVYRYVGQGEGNYEPYIRLVAPEQKQMYALRSTYEFNPNARANMELGMSYFDLNRLSDIGDNDNIGLSGRLDFVHKFALGKKKNWELSPNMQMEVKGKNFRAFNPYRSPEFVRDWNIDPSIQSNEFLGDLGFNLRQANGLSNIGYTYSNFSQLTFYEGHKHNVSSQFSFSGWDIDFNNNFLSSKSQEVETRFGRPKISISKQFERINDWSIGYYGEREKNEVKQVNSDALAETSFWYDYSKFFIRSKQDGNFSLGLGFNQRNDYSPKPGEFKVNTTANEYEVNGNWNVKSLSNASWTFTYRELVVRDAELTEENNNRVLLGNFNHILRLWKGAINSSINYKVSSGQEPKIEFDFREVLSGEGDYIWIDDGDGVQERNEFQIAPFRDQANFVRISLFNNEFIRTNNAGLSQSLRIEPKIFFRRIKNKSKMSKFLSRWSLISNLRVDNKNKGDSGLFSIQQFTAQDTALVSFSSLYNGILFFNKGNPKFDAQLGARDNNNKIVQTLGYEQRGFTEYYLRNRIAISKTSDFIFLLTNGRRSLESEIYKNNDFAIELLRLEPKLTYRLGTSFRLNLDYTYENKRNTLAGERAKINDLNLGFTYSKKSQSRLNANIKYANVNYDGLANTALELNMLDGLKDGRNVLWTIDYSKRIQKNIDISFSYEGRRTGERRIVNVGRAQIKSSF